MRNLKKAALFSAIALLLASPAWSSSPQVGTKAGSLSKASPSVEAAAAAASYGVFVPSDEVQSAGGDAATITTTAQTFTAVDVPKTLNCPGPTKCRVEAVVWASLYNGSTAGNNYALCGYIDGALMAQPNGAKFGCPFSGAVPSDGSVIATTQITAQSQVTPGSHTVQFYVYTSGTATVGLWVAEYRLLTLKPN